MKRLFVAINIVPNSKLLQAYNVIQKRCHSGKIKWVDENLFHLTLKFIGETPQDSIEKISKALRQIAVDTDAFTFNLKGVGIFGSSYHPRIIRVNIEEGMNLMTLGNKIATGLEAIGFPQDRQNFVPHLTLGRIKKVQDKEFFQQTINIYQSEFFQKVNISEIFLYESKLHPSGPEYFILEKYKLT